MDTRRKMKRKVPLWLAAAVFATLAGCGGGVYFTFGNYDQSAPQVNMVVATTTVQAGQSVRLAAAAADDVGIDEVVFYRYDGNTAVRLGADSSAPYEVNLQVPVDGRGSVSVFARAYDIAGNSTDSAIVTLSITP